MKTVGQRRAEARKRAMDENAAGYLAASRGAPLPVDATPAFRAGYADWDAGEMPHPDDAPGFVEFPKGEFPPGGGA